MARRTARRLIVSITAGLSEQNLCQRRHLMPGPRLSGPRGGRSSSRWCACSSKRISTTSSSSGVGDCGRYLASRARQILPPTFESFIRRAPDRKLYGGRPSFTSRVPRRAETCVAAAQIVEARARHRRAAAARATHNWRSARRGITCGGWPDLTAAVSPRGLTGSSGHNEGGVNLQSLESFVPRKPSEIRRPGRPYWNEAAVPTRELSAFACFEMVASGSHAIFLKENRGPALDVYFHARLQPVWGGGTNPDEPRSRGWRLRMESREVGPATRAQRPLPRRGARRHGFADYSCRWAWHRAASEHDEPGKPTRRSGSGSATVSFFLRVAREKPRRERSTHCPHRRKPIPAMCWEESPILASPLTMAARPTIPGELGSTMRMSERPVRDRSAM